MLKTLASLGWSTGGTLVLIGILIVSGVNALFDCLTAYDCRGNLMAPFVPIDIRPEMVAFRDDGKVTVIRLSQARSMGVRGMAEKRPASSMGEAQHSE